MDLPRELYARLYTAAPEDFLTVRGELAGEAKESGEPDTAKHITALRKPTLGAWIVNQQVHAEPGCVERLVDLGTRLRAAHEELDAGTLRDLSTERRQLVTELTTSALTRAGRDDPPAALRDDVTGTFDAAVADPQVAARLGRLTRAEQWSGFGVAMDTPSGAPELTVIRGGRDRPAAAPRPDAEPRPDAVTRPDAAARRAGRRARDRAATASAALDRADTTLHESEAAERAAGSRVHDLSAELTRLRGEIDEAKRDLDRCRRDVKSARNRRREARSALDRAERQVERSDG